MGGEEVNITEFAKFENLSESARAAMLRDLGWSTYAMYSQLAGGAAPDPTVSFAESTWDNIIAVCDAGLIDQTSWAVANEKTLTIDGVDYTVVIIGKKHDSLFSDDTKKAPLTIQLKDCYSSLPRMYATRDTNPGWTNSEMYTTTLPAMLTKLPENIRTAIKPVKKLTTAGGLSTTLVASENRVFLLSRREVFGTSAPDVEGTQYNLSLIHI